MEGLGKIIDMVEEAEGMVDEAKTETGNRYLIAQLNMANISLKEAVIALKEVIKTQSRLKKVVKSTWQDVK